MQIFANNLILKINSRITDMGQQNDSDKKPVIRLKDILSIIAVAAWSIAVLAIDQAARQAPPIVSYLTFTRFQMR